MAKIILTTLNARYSHSSLALRYLYANLNELQKDAAIKEFVINKNNQEIAQKLLENEPRIIGFGVYIWNAQDIKEIIDIIKAVRPDIKIILGGPEVSYAPLRVDLSSSDYIISGEGEVLFYQLCQDILAHKQITQTFFRSPTLDLTKIKLPYAHYSDFDIQNRYIYIESSRGCPFECEFCLSSIDEKVRYFNFEVLLEQLQILWDRGARDFKFIDRTFNLNIKKAGILMDFFLAKDAPYFLHFEFIPDSFPARLKKRLQEFPKGSLQLEVGIQTLNERVAKNINRAIDITKIKQNLAFLSNKTTAHLHLDLLVGLPGESMQSFGSNLDLLMQLSSCEIQIGILKKLSGTTLYRHENAHKMVYATHPPYDILQTDCIGYLQMQKLKRFARYWDMVYNSGNFKESIKLLYKDQSVFKNFYDFCEYFYNSMQSTHQIGLQRVAKGLYDYLTEYKNLDPKRVATVMAKDLARVQGRKLPKFLRPYALEVESTKIERSKQRQQKHL